MNLLLFTLAALATALFLASSFLFNHHSDQP